MYYVCERGCVCTGCRCMSFRCLGEGQGMVVLYGVATIRRLLKIIGLFCRI